jgi:hypothetical protein
MRLEPLNIMSAIPLSSAWEHLDTVGQIVTLRLPPGAGEADRVAHVRKLLDASAELHYAISTYMHRVVAFAGRRPGIGDLTDETVGLQDALDAFSAQTREMANVYRTFVETDDPALDIAPRPALGNQKPSA